MTLITSSIKTSVPKGKRRNYLYIHPYYHEKHLHMQKTQTPSSSTINVDLHLIDMREFPNNQNRRDLFPTTHGDIKNFK